MFQSADKVIVDQKNTEYAAATANEKAAIANEAKKGEQEKKALEATIAPLDPVYYYNKDLKPLTIELAFSNQSAYILPLTKDIERSLHLIGVATKLHEMTGEQFQKDIITEGKKSYDMLLTGIDLGLSSYNIFPFFHS